MGRGPVLSRFWALPTREVFLSYGKLMLSGQLQSGMLRSLRTLAKVLQSELAPRSNDNNYDSILLGHLIFFSSSSLEKGLYPHH